MTDLRLDSFLLGMVAGIGVTCGAIGLYQILVTKGYSIAVELIEAGWTARELRAHRKAAVILPYMQKMREQGGAPQFGSRK